jgi:hypothetical protein
MRAVGVAGVLFALWTIYEVGSEPACSGTSNRCLIPDYIVWKYAVWVLGVPLWFLFDYSVLFVHKSESDAHLFARFKYSHELAQKFWAGVILVLSVLIITKFNVRLG